jgi:uncharacterized phage protein (TIGR02220 family)
MTNEIIISKEHIIPDLTPGEIMLLKIVYDQNKLLFKHYFTTYGANVPKLLESLQNKLYIKSNGEEFEDIIIRQKGLDLFEYDKYENKVTEVLNYFNRKLSKIKPRGFKIASAANRKFVRGRLTEGYEVVDLIKVINIMYDKWIGTTWEEYLRPETLFNATKFQTYINMVDSYIEKDTSVNIDKA